MDATESVETGDGAKAPRKNKRSPDAVDFAVEDRLRAVRSARNLSMAELGGRVDVSLKQIQKYDAGINRLSISMLDMALALEVSPSDLLPHAEAEKNEAIGSIAFELALHVNRLPKPTQKHLLRFVRSILETPADKAD